MPGADGNEPVSSEHVVAANEAFGDATLNQRFNGVQSSSIRFAGSVIADDRNT